MTPREHDFGRGPDPADDRPHTERVHRGEGFRSDSGGALDLEGKTKAELLALAEERGVEVSGTKAEIVAALSAE
jgi:hypothetical protein